MDYQTYYNIMKNMTDNYEVLEGLYQEKQQALISGNHEALTSVDGKILECVKTLQTCNQERLEISGETKLTDIIVKLEEEKNPNISEFKALKVKLSELKSKLMLLEGSNVELIKHGLVMADKTLNIMVNTLVPQTNEYDKSGKNIDGRNMEISSIVEEV